MALEIEDAVTCAVRFLVSRIEIEMSLKEKQKTDFTMFLTEKIMDKYKEHWFPDSPKKGQGYRCIICKGTKYVDPLIRSALEKISIKEDDIKLSKYLYIWIDPDEVAYTTDDSEDDSENYYVLLRAGDPEHAVEKLKIETKVEDSHKQSKEVLSVTNWTTNSSLQKPTVKKKMDCNMIRPPVVPVMMWPVMDFHPLTAPYPPIQNTVWMRNTWQMSSLIANGPATSNNNVQLTVLSATQQTSITTTCLPNP